MTAYNSHYARENGHKVTQGLILDTLASHVTQRRWSKEMTGKLHDANRALLTFSERAMDSLKEHLGIEEELEDEIESLRR